jgi:hypothetical protein
MFGLFKTPLQKLLAQKAKLESIIDYEGREHRRTGYKAMEIDMMLEPMRWARWQQASNGAYYRKMQAIHDISALNKEIVKLQASEVAA